MIHSWVAWVWSTTKRVLYKFTYLLPITSTSTTYLTPEIVECQSFAHCHWWHLSSCSRLTHYPVSSSVSSQWVAWRLFAHLSSTETCFVHCSVSIHSKCCLFQMEVSNNIFQCLVPEQLANLFFVLPFEFWHGVLRVRSPDQWRLQWPDLFVTKLDGRGDKNTHNIVSLVTVLYSV